MYHSVRFTVPFFRQSFVFHVCVTILVTAVTAPFCRRQTTRLTASSVELRRESLRVGVQRESVRWHQSCAITMFRRPGTMVSLLVLLSGSSVRVPDTPVVAAFTVGADRSNGNLRPQRADCCSRDMRRRPLELTSRLEESVEEVASRTNTIRATSRRRLVLGALTTTVISTRLPKKSIAAFRFVTNDQDRRQLEFCLVAVLRVSYWAKRQARAMQEAATTEDRKSKYLEARLGAKAILTGKVGSGATGKVYTLATLQLPACLADLEWHATTRQLQRQVSDWRRDFSEGLAAIVEFDGLDTLIDPSPRSSLTLSQYSNDKAVFVRRALQELVIPAGNKLVAGFGAEALQRSLNYIQQYYSSEIPPIVTVNEIPIPTISNPSPSDTS